MMDARMMLRAVCSSVQIRVTVVRTFARDVEKLSPRVAYPKDEAASFMHSQWRGTKIYLRVATLKFRNTNNHETQKIS